jgi:hypothetical protein
MKMGFEKSKLYYCIEVFGREVLLKGNAQYGWPPCNNKFRSAPFYNENMIYFLTKQATLMRRSTVLSLPTKLVFPGFGQKLLCLLKRCCHHNSETFKYFADADIVSDMVMESQYDARQYKIILIKLIFI